jgi:2-methylisocitrate lyase-like PEP mutase family enzyme
VSLAALLGAGGLCIPGCWDGLSALMVERSGFGAAFLTGGGLSMARLGRADMGLVTAPELVDAVERICDRVAIPLVVDADTGFGGTLNLQHALRRIERAGAAAVVIEDQQFPKRCGHMAGKQVVPMTEAVGRIRAAVDAKGRMLLVARTDALAIEGVDAACDRAGALLDAGADALFIEGPSSMEEARTIARAFPETPLIHNLVEGGTTPSTRSADFFALGFAATLHPLLLMHVLAAAGPEALAVLKRDGSTDALSGRIATLQDMNRLTGAQDMIEQDARYAPDA